MRFSALIVIAALCSAALCRAQEPSLDDGYRQMYNLQFVQAHKTFQDWSRLHPDDPLSPASDAAAYLFSEFDRLHILQSEFFTQDRHFITDHKLSPDPVVKDWLTLSTLRSVVTAVSNIGKSFQQRSLRQRLSRRSA